MRPAWRDGGADQPLHLVANTLTNRSNPLAVGLRLQHCHSLESITVAFGGAENSLLRKGQGNPRRLSVEQHPASRATGAPGSDERCGRYRSRTAQSYVCRTAHQTPTAGCAAEDRHR